MRKGNRKAIIDYVRSRQGAEHLEDSVYGYGPEPTRTTKPYLGPEQYKAPKYTAEAYRSYSFTEEDRNKTKRDLRGADPKTRRQYFRDLDKTIKASQEYKDWKATKPRYGMSIGYDEKGRNMYSYAITNKDYKTLFSGSKNVPTYTNIDPDRTNLANIKYSMSQPRPDYDSVWINKPGTTSTDEVASKAAWMDFYSKSHLSAPFSNTKQTSATESSAKVTSPLGPVSTGMMRDRGSSSPVVTSMRDRLMKFKQDTQDTRASARIRV